MRMRLSAIIFGAFVSIALPTQSSALDRISLMFVQQTLDAHGFDVGTPDGQMGPATRRGLSEFAAKYGVDSDANEVMNFMIQKSVNSRISVEDPNELSVIKEGISKRLRDPASAEIRDVYRVTNVDKELICGEVNGKNAYGAMAGYQAFYGMMLFDKFLPIQLDGSDSMIGEMICLFAFEAE